MKFKIICSLLSLFIVSVLNAQNKFSDKLIKRNGEVIECEIHEIGDDEIKYSLADFRSDVLFGIDKNKVSSITFSDGRELKFQDSMYGQENYADQRKNIFKFNFLSPLMGATAFGYEHSLRPGRSIEARLGIIGWGQDLDDYNASGVFTSIGYKFIKDPDFYMKGMRYAHLLKGAYFKPELAFSFYNYSNHTYMGSNRVTDPDTKVRLAAIILNVGKQWIIANRFSIDWYVGAGYGFGKNDEYDNSYNYAFIGATDETSLVLNSGFRIGVLF